LNYLPEFGFSFFSDVNIQEIPAARMSSITCTFEAKTYRAIVNIKVRVQESDYVRASRLIICGCPFPLSTSHHQLDGRGK
jgi:hypothetical protein